jgi:hypothetical protein
LEGLFNLSGNTISSARVINGTIIIIIIVGDGTQTESDYSLMKQTISKIPILGQNVTAAVDSQSPTETIRGMIYIWNAINSKNKAPK